MPPPGNGTNELIKVKPKRGSYLRDAPKHARRGPGLGVKITRWVGAAVVVAIVGTAGYAWINYQNFVSGITHVNAIPTRASDAPTDVDSSDQNILLVGDDHRPANATPEMLAELGTEDDGGALNTDTMMVMHIPADGSKATVISLPRDSWVDIPGYGMNKLNSAFSLGMSEGDESTGAQLLITTIQNLTGLQIDHYVRVSLLGFYNIAKALGPVNVCLTEAVDDPYSTLTLPAGVSTLDAHQALAFVRQRHGLPRGDLDRVVRQQYFLSAEARKVLDVGTLLNPVKLNDVLQAVSSSIETDPDLNLIQLAAQVRNLTSGNITYATIPNLGTGMVDGLSVVKIDNASMPSFIATIVGPSSAYTQAVPAAPGAVTVTVTNAAGVMGVAGEAITQLNGFGFLTTEPDSADIQTLTTISYPAGQEAAAKALAAYVPGAVVIESSAVTALTLTLGSDGLTPVDPNAIPAQSAEPPAENTTGNAPAAPAPAAPAPAAPEPSAAGQNFAEGTCIN